MTTYLTPPAKILCRRWTVSWPTPTPDSPKIAPNLDRWVHGPWELVVAIGISESSHDGCRDLTYIITTGETFGENLLVDSVPWGTPRDHMDDDAVPEYYELSYE